ncbi:SAM-dependent methyltransferase [Cryptosporangium aurantiacum]|uniref:S-adenosyl methyltransferase n=1 Tax=Cryptosporangium aurantiacum TaxID=134849 RepID=A0A1M7RN87_9ACTN|nr:SAM-dependent methyltransferase [Cryptosporangium aurantiacum]SHN47536.1 S-adenosyl methyltransferase [Cryptosporangium aurantiacum]
MPEDAQRLIDTSTAHPARRYDYWLGGKDNFAADRESADAIARLAPLVPKWARENRWFMRRAVAYLAREAGIRQFLDIGTGIPTSPNLHEVAQAIAPESRVVYVDNDPIVLTHARALLTSGPHGRTAYLDADLAEPEDILGSDEVTTTLDLSRPVALSLIAVLHFFKDAQDPHGIVRRLVSALPSGSYLAISHNTWDYLPEPRRAALESAVKDEGQCRDRAQFTRFFDGLELVDPGVVVLSEWRRDDSADLPLPEPWEISAYGAVARIP